MREELELYNDSYETEESESEIGNEAKRGRTVQRKAIVTINDSMRVSVEENCLVFQRKSDGKEDNNSQDSNWYNDGYFGDFDSVIEYARKVCVKEKIFKKCQVDLAELVQIIRETKEELKNKLNGQ